MRVLIADGKAEVRFALRALLETQPGVTVAGEAADAESLLTQACLAGADLILLDWDLPAPEGAAVLAALRAAAPAVQVLILSGRQEAREPALAAGADGFVSKAEPPGQLLGAIERCARRQGETP